MCEGEDWTNEEWADINKTLSEQFIAEFDRRLPDRRISGPVYTASQGDVGFLVTASCQVGDVQITVSTGADSVITACQVACDGLIAIAMAYFTESISHDK